MKQVRELGLTQGRGPLPKSLLKGCHQGRLIGGLSISLQATPDEVVGALTFAMGVTTFKVLDVRTSTPLVMEIGWGELVEKWELENVEALVHNLNDLFREAPRVKLLVMLGDWEDMLQVWALERDLLKKLLSGRLLDEARNAPTLRRLFGDSKSTPARSRGGISTSLDANGQSVLWGKPATKLSREIESARSHLDADRLELVDEEQPLERREDDRLFQRVMFGQPLAEILHRRAQLEPQRVQPRNVARQNQAQHAHPRHRRFQREVLQLHLAQRVVDHGVTAPQTWRHRLVFVIAVQREHPLDVISDGRRGLPRTTGRAATRERLRHGDHLARFDVRFEQELDDVTLLRRKVDHGLTL